MLTLLVRGAARKQVSPEVRRALRRQVERALRAAGQEGAEVCISLTDDAELLELNRTYAGEDHATDVLSFAQGPRGAAGRAPGPGGLLGDVVVSVETAGRQAQGAGHELGDELLHLCVHGICHLLGYDHATPAEEKEMFGYEALLREQARGSGRVRPVAAQVPPI